MGEPTEKACKLPVLYEQLRGAILWPTSCNLAELIGIANS